MKQATRLLASYPLEDRPEAEISELHGPIDPVEVYNTDPIEAELEYQVAGVSVRTLLPVWRISPLGVELALPKDTITLNTIVQGQTVNLRVKLKNQICEFRGLVVTSTHSQNDRKLVGIRWFADPNSEKSPQTIGKPNRRKADRWACGQDFMPIGVAPNPTRFNDFIQFKVIDISASGMLLATSLRNKMLIPGMVLDATVSFPMCSQLSVKFQIVHARVGTIEDRQLLLLGVVLHKPDRKLLNSIGQYVFQFGPRTSVDYLKKQGLRVENASQGIEFGYVRTEEDYKEVLSLRKQAYTAAGKLDPNVAAENLADIYDTRARILTARHREELVASVRLIFHEADDKFELEEHLQLPPTFPKNYESVEISRLCTHNDFRQSDLFYAITRRAFLTAAQAKRRWMCTFATPNLISLYKKIGGRPAGISFQHKGLNGREHEVLVWDMPKVLSGANVNPFVWNIIVSDMTDYVRDQDAVDFDPMMNLRVGVYRLLKPLTPLFFRARARRKK